MTRRGVELVDSGVMGGISLLLNSCSRVERDLIPTHFPDCCTGGSCQLEDPQTALHALVHPTCRVPIWGHVAQNDPQTLGSLWPSHRSILALAVERQQ